MKPFPGTVGAVILLTLGLLGGMLGCQGPRPISGDVQVPLPDEEAYRQFWFHALSSVRHFGYDMERADPAAGVILSNPLTSKQWFEFWRNDTLGSDQVLEASLQTTRRQVRVEVQPMPANRNEYVVSVRVNVQRFSQTERQVTTSSSAAQAFAKLPAVQPAPGMAADTGPHWVDLGRDRTLEAAILRQISHYPDARIVAASGNQAAVTTEPATQPAEQE